MSIFSLVKSWTIKILNYKQMIHKNNLKLHIIKSNLTQANDTKITSRAINSNFSCYKQSFMPLIPLNELLI